MSRWSESLEAGAKVGAFLLGVGYFSGFVILNLHVQFQAASLLGPFSQQYLVVGFWFFLITLPAMLPAPVAVLLVLEFLGKQRSWKEALKASQSALLLVITVILLFSPMQQMGVRVSTTWSSFLLFAFGGGVFLSLDLANLFNESSPDDVIAKRAGATTRILTRIWILFPLLLLTFADDVYPTIPGKVGGGDPSTVLVIPTQETREALRSLGMSPEKGGGISCRLIIATQEAIIVASGKASRDPVVIPRSGIIALLISN